MYMHRNIKAYSRDHFFSEKAINITYFCACARAWVRACIGMHAYACVHACVRACACAVYKNARVSTYACLSRTYLTQHAKLMRHFILPCVLSGPTIFFHTLSKTAQFSEKHY